VLQIRDDAGDSLQPQARRKEERLGLDQGRQGVSAKPKPVPHETLAGSAWQAAVESAMQLIRGGGDSDRCIRLDASPAHLSERQQRHAYSLCLGRAGAPQEEQRGERGDLLRRAQV